MSRLKAKIADILAYPVSFFENLNDNKAPLLAGIILVGAIDLLLPDVSKVIRTLFSGKPMNDILYNAAMTAFVIIILGFIDVVFVSVPLFDIFKYLKRKEVFVDGNARYENNRDSRQESRDGEVNAAYRATPVKVMKVYIMSHFIIIPVSMLVYYIFTRNLTESSPAWMLNLASLFFMLIIIWSAAILARGINVLFHFHALFRRLSFIIVFIWNFVFGMVFDMQIMNWILKLFK